MFFSSIFVFFAVRNSLKLYGRTFLVNVLPLSSVDISLLSSLDEEPVIISFMSFLVSLILLHHLLQFGIFCISSKKKYFMPSFGSNNSAYASVSTVSSSPLSG